MKKLVTTLLLATMLVLPEAIMPNVSTSVPSEWTATGSREFRPCPSGTYRVKRKSRRGRRIANSLIAGGVLAAVGGGIGGGKGALLGLGTGTGGYLVYRWVKTKNGKCVRRGVRG